MRLPIFPFAVSATATTSTIQPGLFGLARRFGRALRLNVPVHGVLEGLAVNDDLVGDLLEGSGFPKRKRDAPGCVLPVELQLLDLVWLAAYQTLPVLKVAAQVVLGRIFDEYKRHVVGRQAVQESCLRLRAPAILGLRLQLQVRVHDQSRRLLRARALLGGEVVGLARCLEVAVLHDLLQRHRAVLSVLGVGDELGQCRLGAKEQRLGKSPRDALDLDCLVFLDLLLPVSGRQLLRLGRGGRRGRRGSGRRCRRRGRECFPALLPHMSKASACHWKLCLGQFQNCPVVQIHRLAKRRDDCFVKFLDRLPELGEDGRGRHTDVRDVLPEALGCARGRKQRLQGRVHGSGGAGTRAKRKDRAAGGQTTAAKFQLSPEQPSRAERGRFFSKKRCVAIPLLSSKTSWRCRWTRPQTEPARAPT